MAVYFPNTSNTKHYLFPEDQNRPLPKVTYTYCLCSTDEQAAEPASSEVTLTPEPTYGSQGLSGNRVITLRYSEPVDISTLPPGMEDVTTPLISFSPINWVDNGDNSYTGTAGGTWQSVAVDYRLVLSSVASVSGAEIAQEAKQDLLLSSAVIINGQ